jgi:NADPH2:quinone reductase
MRAVRCNAFTGPADLVIEEVEPPEPEDDEIRVRVHAASINFYDNLMVAGEYQMKPDLPFTAGSDAAGVVIETGSRVTRLKPGDRVAVGHYIGTFADEMVAKEWTAVVMPDGVDFAEAAAMRVAHGTAYYGLARRGALKAGETLLVHGASGGVGLAAVQLGRQLGATVIGTVGDEAKAGIVRDNGAAHVLTYDGETRLRDRVKELCADGADVIFDVVGGDVFDESLRCIAWDGRLLVVGFTSGRIPSAPANLALLKHCSITGVFFGAWMGRNHADYRADAEQLLAWCASGEVRPHVSATYPLEDAVEAMAVLAERKATGKVVLTMN